jgi:hypothetical protein
LLTAKQFADEDETGHDGHVTRRLLKTSSVGEVFVISAFGSVMTTSRLSLSRTPPVATAPSSTHPRDTESLAHRRPPACDPRHTSTRKLSGTTRLPTGRTRHKSSWSEIISWQRDTHAFHVQPELEDYAGDDTSYRHRTVLIAQLSSRNTVMSRCYARSWRHATHASLQIGQSCSISRHTETRTCIGFALWQRQQDFRFERSTLTPDQTQAISAIHFTAPSVDKTSPCQRLCFLA